MIKEVKLKSIYINEKKADGTPYIDKNYEKMQKMW
jgi:hypothetical protein